MKLSISNLGWRPEEDAAVAALLRERGIHGIELVPTRAWLSPAEATRDEAMDVRSRWSDLGISVVAFQSLLFRRPELLVFGSSSEKAALRAHLAALFQLAEWVGAGALVFGSPGNRRRGPMSAEAATGAAVPFFRQVGASAADHGVVLCVEPNPPSVGCDFITTPSEAIAFVEAVAHPGIRVQFDTAAQAASGESPAVALAGGVALLGHAHASEPGLGELGQGSVDHGLAASALREREYKGWVSVEMLAADSDNVARVTRALEVATQTYGVVP